MVGCGYVASLVAKQQMERGEIMDSEIIISIQFAPLKHSAGDKITGTIGSTRDKMDPLFFEPFGITSSAIYTEQAIQSIWRMDVEIIMVMISLTLSCFFVGLQLLHVKKNQEKEKENVFGAAHWCTLNDHQVMNLSFVLDRDPVSLCGSDQNLEDFPVLRDSSKTLNSSASFDSIAMQMETKALTEEAISMTEKKMNMSLDDIIKMSKKNAAKGKRPPRPPIKNQGFQNRNPSHGNALLQGFMDSRSSIRQGVLAKRRSNVHGNQFTVITEMARKAAASSVQNRMRNPNGGCVLTPLQRSADADSDIKDHLRADNCIVQLQALDAIFANMNAMRMDFVIEKINPGGSMQLVQRPFGSRQQQRRGGRRPRGGVRPGQRCFGSGQRQGRGGPHGGAHGGRRAADRLPSAH
ncbi:hypothetical protein ZIOFF_075336 [Zingiber officinale]|uniref:RING-type E3 ubiquitin transferase n=1 Tax=Zingiber officinale TaxID=94328 RepID=A0A8J5EMV4_ZINOF|nr:hypothetical protein ZIOFF_075336 [Zingiber officinale]